MGREPTYSGKTLIDGSDVLLIDGPNETLTPFTHLYVVNTDETNDFELKFGANKKFYIPAGYIGGLPELKCNSDIKAAKISSNVDSVYITAW